MSFFTASSLRTVEPAPAGVGVRSDIRAGAVQAGVSPDFLTAVAQRESSLQPEARAATSSASGLFQFIEQTWLRMVRDAGADVGLGTQAAAIGTDSKGRATTNDPQTRRAILALRNDPFVSSYMAGRLAQANGTVLSAQLGREPNEAELYLAHVLGPAGAAKAITAAASDPEHSAAALFPQAAAANRSLFYGRQGHARTIAAFVEAIEGSYQHAAVQAGMSAPSGTAASEPSSRVFSFDGLFQSGSAIAQTGRATAARDGLDLSDFFRRAFLPSADTATATEHPLDLTSFMRKAGRVS